MNKNSIPRSNLLLYLWIVLAFLLSQFFAYYLGIRFAGSKNIIIEPFWQYLDPQLLQADLFRSLYYLHSQPPLFNAFLGIILKLFPNHYELVFAGILRSAGLGCLLLMAMIMRGIGIHRILIAALCTTFALFPNFLIYSNLLFYTLPVSFLLLLSCFFLQNLTKISFSKYAVLFTLTCTAIMLTRSIYHLGWFVVCIAIISPMLHNSTSRIFLRAAAIPFFIVVCLYAKNAVIAGSPGPSSWLGMNFSRGWLPPSKALADYGAFIRPEEGNRLLKANKINPEWLAGPFNSSDAYRKLGYFNDQNRSRHPAISSPVKTGGFPNFNHADYAKLSKKMLETTRAIIVEFPEKYLARILLGFQMYLQPATGPSWFLVQSYDYSSVERYRNFIDRLLFWGRPIELRRGYIPWNTLYFLFPALIIFGAAVSVKARKDTNSTKRLVYSYVTITIVWVALITNLIEFGENNRIRFETDPFLLILFGAAIQSAMTWVQSFRSKDKEVAA